MKGRAFRPQRGCSVVRSTPLKFLTSSPWIVDSSPRPCSSPGEGLMVNCAITRISLTKSMPLKAKPSKTRRIARTAGLWRNVLDCNFFDSCRRPRRRQTDDRSELRPARLAPRSDEKPARFEDFPSLEAFVTTSRTFSRKRRCASVGDGRCGTPECGVVTQGEKRMGRIVFQGLIAKSSICDAIRTLLAGRRRD